MSRAPEVPPGVQVPPATPALQATDISALYDIMDFEQKGTGAFSRVVVGRNKNENVLRAIKIMEREKLVGKMADMVVHEKEILRRVNHKSIVRLHRCVQTKEKVYFELDLMDGDLFDYIVKHKKLSERDTALVMRQLFSAVEYLHSIHIIHRDIKPENILINSPSDIKLADFGLAKVLTAWTVNSTPCGTSFYIAPEIIRGIELQGVKPLCTNREEVKFVDLWSCGVVMFMLLAGTPPFSGQVKTSSERKALLTKIDRGVLFPEAQWQTISEDAKDLILGMLCQDTHRRLTATQALGHRFFKILQDKKTTERDAEQKHEAPLLEGPELKQQLNELQQVIVEHVDGEKDVDNSYRPPEVAAVQQPTEVKQGGSMKRLPGQK